MGFREREVLLGSRMAEVFRRLARLPNRGGTCRTAEVLGPFPFGTWHSCWQAYTCCCMTLCLPQPVGGPTVLMTPAALGCCQETVWQLGFLCCWKGCWRVGGKHFNIPQVV